MQIQSGLSIVVVLVTCMLGSRADASAFFGVDARSAAMGGVGVASGVKAAPLTNPALLAYGVEFVDWYLTAPTYSAVRNDPDKMSSLLKDFQKSAQALENNRDAAALLDKLSKARRIENTGQSIFATIPSNVLGAGAYLNFYQFASVRAVSASPNVAANPSAYNTVIEKRGVSVGEHGISLAQVFTTDFRAFDTTNYQPTRRRKGRDCYHHPDHRVRTVHRLGTSVQADVHLRLLHRAVAEPVASE